MVRLCNVLRAERVAYGGQAAVSTQRVALFSKTCNGVVVLAMSLGLPLSQGSNQSSLPGTCWPAVTGAVSFDYGIARLL
jgi:hypothetical protein